MWTKEVMINVKVNTLLELFTLDTWSIVALPRVEP